MKANVTIKALSAAVLGLAGMAFAGGAMAQCAPGGTAGANWPGGQITLGGGTLSLDSPGLKGTACKAGSALGASGTSAAAVSDTTPANETRYRFRFYLDADLVNTFSGAQIVQLFTANSANPFPAAGGSVQMVRAIMIPSGTNKAVRFIVATDDSANNNITTSPSAVLVAGSNWIEGELIVGGAGTGKFNYWVNNNTEGTPTGTLNVNNSAWVGVDTANLGLAAGNATFRSLNAGKKVYLDEFDSRRTTFIGQ